MVKRREPATAKKQPTAEEIEAFASGVDGGNNKPLEEKSALDPRAKRNFNAINVPFNKYEYSKLEELAAKTGRTKLNAIRWAIIKLAEEVQ